MLPPKSILALLDAALGGDHSAAQQLTRDFLMPVADAAATKYLFGRAARRLEKEDVVQECVAHLCADNWAKLRQYDRTKSSLLSFVFGVVRNWIRDEIRSKDPPEPTDEIEQDGPPDSHPENDAYMAEIMGRAMELLDDEEILIFRWLYLDGLTREQIAFRLSLEMDNTYKRLQEVEKKIKKAISNPEAPVRNKKGKKP